MSLVPGFFEHLNSRSISSSVFPGAMIVAAHPDDEVVGAGGILPYLKDPTIVHVTDGAPRNLQDATSYGFYSRESYARVRREEALAALSCAGVMHNRCIQLRYIDQEASLNMIGLICRLARLIENIKPQVIVTHAFEGGHPDHDTTAFASWVACRILEKQRKAVPDLIEFAAYHGNGNQQMITHEFLQAKGHEICTIELGDMERNLKRQMIECHGTQARVLSAFGVEKERFRSAPRYDFTKPPHAGTVLYEYFDWGMSYRRWKVMADEALRILKVGK